MLWSSPWIQASRNVFSSSVPLLTIHRKFSFAEGNEREEATLSDKTLGFGHQPYGMHQRRLQFGAPFFYQSRIDNGF